MLEASGAWWLRKHQSARVWVRERFLLRWELQFLAHCYVEASSVCDSCLASLHQWEYEGINTKLWALLKHKSPQPRHTFCISHLLYSGMQD